MSIKSDLKELVENGVLTQEAADNVISYYLAKKNSSNKALIIFGVIGALSIGLGIISIIASNWDAYSRFTKTAFSVLPLLLGQILAAYTLLKRKESDAWKESSAVFLLMAFGAVMAMIGQVYNLPSNLHSFITVWIWFALPLLYLLNSSSVALLFLGGITAHSFMFAQFKIDDISDHSFWLFLILYLPFYISKIKDQAHSFGLRIQHWFVPITILLGCIPHLEGNEELVLTTYLSLFILLYIIGKDYLENINQAAYSTYTRIASLGIFAIVLLISFDQAFGELMDGALFRTKWEMSSSFILLLLTTFGAVGLLVRNFLSTKIDEISSSIWAATAIMVLIFVSQFINLPEWIGLVLSMAIGAHMIKKATDSLSMTDMNFGLAVILIPIISRFMNARMDFVIKGLILILLGTGFILVNVFLKRKMRGQK